MDVSAAIPDWLEVAAGVAAALTTLLVFGGIIGRSKLGRWLWRHLVRDPFEDWTARQLEPLHTAISRIQDDIAPTNGDRRSISDRVDSAKKTAESVESRLNKREVDIDQRLDSIERKLSTGQNEIKGAITAVAESRP